MVPFTWSSNTFVSPLSLLGPFTCGVLPSCFCGFNPEKKGDLVSQKLNIDRRLEFGEENKRVSWSRWCKKGWDSDGDLALEAEILEFMRNTDKPGVFPSKKELVDGGRMDLVERIEKGGWLAMGWDLDADNQQNAFQEGGVKVKEWDEETFQERVQSEVESSGTSYSGSSLEVAAEDNCGIDGILSRLERERKMNFGFGFREKGDNTFSQSNNSEEESIVQASMDATVGGPGTRRLVPFSNSSGVVNDNRVKFGQNRSLPGVDGLRNPKRVAWSLPSAKFAGKESQGDETLEIREKSSELDRRKGTYASEKETNRNEIQSRLEHIKLELSSVLQSLMSNVDEILSLEGDGSSDDNLHQLSDAWEFQEYEIMNAQDKLRSMRARLVVLEGKMALAIIDARKTLEEKQRRIDDARRASQLLRTACIVWPNSASEVLLAGSFDGWATKRKMEKSSTGVFSLSLKLNPGKYEIKFIVDGEWKIDPLHPIVNNNGYKNNLLIIT